jgi:predicted phosphodiesterase
MKSGKQSKVDDKVIIQLVEQFPGETFQSYADKLQQDLNITVSADTVRKKLKKLGIEKGKKTTAEAPAQEATTGSGTVAIISDRINSGDPTVDYLDALIEFQEKMVAADERQTRVTVEIPDSKPIGVIFTCDWHFGGLRTDHEGMINDFELFNQTEGLYGVLMGDYGDNVISGIHPGAQYEQILNPDKQREAIDHLVGKYFKDRTLAVIKGNHDNWQVRSTGDDFCKELSRTANAAYLWYGGQINMKFGEQTYTIQARHTYKYNSGLNTTNSQRNLFANTHADVIALGHIHTNETHEKSVGGKDTIWMRTGSYKITDDYSQWIGGYSADPRVPMVVFWPDKNKKVGFRDIRDGITFLNAIRKS